MATAKEKVSAPEIHEEHEERVIVRLPRKKGEEVVDVCINGVVTLIKRGVDVEVPLNVALVLDSADRVNSEVDATIRR